ncbi:MAG: ABC transporter substrate-binding protein [Rhodoferax sp.]
MLTPSRRVWLRCLGGLGLAWACMAPASAQQPPLVAVLASERSSSYSAALEALQGELQRVGSASLVTGYGADAAAVDALVQRSPRVLVALGAAAVRAALASDSRVPLIAALVPRATFDKALRETPRKSNAPVYALYLDQPLPRQLELIAQVLPHARRVGVLWGPESSAQRAALQSALQARGWSEAPGMVGDGSQVGEVLQQTLDGADAFLALADPVVFNPATVSNILLGTYRARVPVFAFAPAYAKAGALVALYSTPAQIGQQSAEMARAVLRGASLPSGQHPVDFQITVNMHVAHTLGVGVDESTLTERLKRQERKP